MPCGLVQERLAAQQQESQAQAAAKEELRVKLRAMEGKLLKGEAQVCGGGNNTGVNGPRRGVRGTVPCWVLSTVRCHSHHRLGCTPS